MERHPELSLLAETWSLATNESLRIQRNQPRWLPQHGREAQTRRSWTIRIQVSITVIINCIIKSNVSRFEFNLHDSVKVYIKNKMFFKYLKSLLL